MIFVITVTDVFQQPLVCAKHTLIAFNTQYVGNWEIKGIAIIGFCVFIFQYMYVKYNHKIDKKRKNCIDFIKLT